MDGHLPDVEDIGVMTSSPLQAAAHDDVIVPRIRRRTLAPKSTEISANALKESSETMGDFVQPGKGSIFLRTWGCSHNASDGEYMAGQLSAAGFEITERWDDADLFLLNSCTVKGRSQDTFLNEVRRAKSAAKPVVIAGCVPQGQPNSNDWIGTSVVGVQQIDRVVDAVQESLKGNTVRYLARSKKKIPRLDLPKIRRNPWIEIVPINLGCLNQCTYCKTKHARGDLHSYTPEAIVERCDAVLAEGIVELRITSEDTGAYGRDLGTDLPTVLRQIVQLLDEWSSREMSAVAESGELPTLPMLRLGMTNPPYILEHLDAIGELLNHPRIFSFLHVPVQSGSDAVLEAMKREYTCADFQRVVDRLRELCPDVTIATDIICGFPGETEDDFARTLQLVARNRFPVLNISQFYARPGTPAARMKRVPSDVVKDRSRRLTTLFNEYHADLFAPLIGRRATVLLAEVASDGHNLAGHTKNYTQVLVSPSDAALGCSAEVELTDASTWSCTGRVIRRGVPRSGAQSLRTYKRRRKQSPILDREPGEPLPSKWTYGALLRALLLFVAVFLLVLRQGRGYF